VIGYDDYDPWGYPLALRTKPIPNAYLQGASKNKFTGKEYDDEIGLKWYHFDAGRKYMPDIARWAAPDPVLRDKLPNDLVKLQNGKLLSTSPYGYAFDHPLRYTDPDGKTPWDIVDWAMFAKSAYDFYKNPTWANAGWAVADLAGAALPIVPSTGIFRHGAKLITGTDAAMEIVKGAERLEDIGSAIRRIEGTSDLSEAALTGFRQIDSNIKDHLKALDLSGALKEWRGITIVDKSGNVRDHIQEVNNALRGLKSGVEKLKAALGSSGLSKVARERIESKISTTSILIDDIERFLSRQASQ
jgi:RHS repeat-associated protein